jgi:hypothetical protein
MRERFDLLTPTQNESALQIIHGDLPPSSVSETAPLEAAASYFQYRRLRGENRLEDSDQKIYTALLLQRAKQGRTPDNEILPVPQSSRDTQPDLGHSPYLLGIGGGVLEEGTHLADFSELHFRFAYHDLLNKDLGYIRFSEVEFPSLTLRYSATLHSLWIEKLGVLSVFSLFPMTELEKRPSWKVDFSYISPKDLNCVDCHALMLEGGAGAAEGLLSDHLLFYSMALLHLEAGSSIRNGIRFMPTLLTAALVNPFTNYKSRLSGAVIADVGQSLRQSHFYELKWDQSLSLSQNWETRLNAEIFLPGNRQTNVTYEEYSLSLNHYF